MKSRYVKTHRSRDIDKSILFVSSHIFKSLKKSGKGKFNDIFLQLYKRFALKEKDFIFALNFLFILGVVDYDKSRDVLIYKK